MKKFKSWVLTVLFSIMFLSTCVVLFNYFVDSFSLFQKSKSGIVDDLIDGYYITGDNISSNRVENIYEPLIKKIKKIDVLAIGSSRTMLLHHDLLFKNKKVSYYNFTDGTANLDHYARILGLFNKYSIRFPKVIILGIDPWIFDKQTSLSRINRLISNTSHVDKSKYMQLFNFEYTLINLKSLLINNKYKKSYSLDELLNIKNRNIIISPDGDLYNPMFASNITSVELIKKEKSMLKKCDKTNYNTKCVKYEKLNNFKVLKYIIDYLKSKDVNAYFF